MKGTKKRIALLLAIIMVFKLTFVANAQSPPTYEQLIREQILVEYENDSQFNLMRDHDNDLADDFINKLVQNEMSKLISPFGLTFNGTVAYVDNVKVVKQTTTTNCSAATLLQTLYGLNKAGTVSGSTDAVKQTTLYNKTDHATAPGARVENNQTGNPLFVYEITNYLNTKITHSYYKYQEGSAMTLSTFKTRLFGSLVYDRPVMLHAVTGPISYYNGNSLVHYLSVSEYDKNTEKVKIVDCHYDSPYGGSHFVDVVQAYQSVSNVSGRYAIWYA